MADGSFEGKLERVDRVLVIELWNIGDVILLLPFLAQLRQVFPNARITLAAKSFAEDLLAGTGLVDEIIESDLSWGPSDSVPAKISGILQAGWTLRSRRFDIAFSGRGHVRERFLLALSGAGRRVAHSTSQGDRFLTDAVAIASEPPHRVAAWLGLLGPFGGPVNGQTPRLHVADSERSWADEFLASRGASGGDVIVGIHPGASVAEKRWPLDRFRDVAITLGSRPGVRVIAFAEPSGYGNELFTVPGVIGAQVSLRELIALIDRCDLLVCNDSGPMHIAGALGVPTVAMFGAGIADWFAPLGDNHEILRPTAVSDTQRYSGAIRSPTEIGTEQVLDAVERGVQRLKASRSTATPATNK